MKYNVYMSAKKIAFWLSLGFIVAFVAFAGYKLGEENIKYDKLRQWTEEYKGEVFDNSSDISSNSATSTVAPTNIETESVNFDFSKYRIVDGNVNTTTPYKKYSVPSEIASLIKWNKPTKITSLGYFFIEQGSDRTDLNGENIITASDYYLVGTFDYNNKNGAIVVADIICEECFSGSTLPATMFVLYDGKVIFLDKTAVESKSFYPPKDYLVRNSVFVDDNFTISTLDKNVIFEKNGVRYTLVPTFHDGPTIRSHSSVATEIVYIHPTFGPVYKFENKFEMLGQDGRSWYFQYRPNMVNEENDFEVVFDNKTKNTYKYISPNGCGRMTDPAVLTNIATSSLVRVGIAGGKYPVFVNNNSVTMRSLYDSMYFPDGTGKISYDKFVKENPIVYFYDDFDRLIQATEKKYQPAAECGKPVIYLYPEKTTKVKVQVELSHWSYSDPEYRGGWEVIAETNGRLIETRTGKIYPYLFWEGTGVGEQPEANSGFVVKQEEVLKFLSDKLSQLGLNTKESADFREFWEPRMARAPYYFITFYGTSAMNKIAPLKIEPKPDTVIRVLMDYRPLEKYEEVKEQKLSAPARHGFTVIEWGGVLGRE